MKEKKEYLAYQRGLLEGENRLLKTILEQLLKIELIPNVVWGKA